MLRSLCVVALLAGCSTIPAPSLDIQISDGADRSPFLVGNTDTEIMTSQGVSIEADSAPAVVSIEGPFCHVVAHILGEVGKVRHSCDGGGTVAFDSGIERPSHEIVRDFLSVVSFRGGRINQIGDLVHVSHTGGDFGAVQGQGDFGPGTTDLGEVQIVDDPASTLFRDTVRTARIGARAGGDVLVVADGSSAEDVRYVAAALELPVTVAPLGRSVVAYGSPAVLQALRRAVYGFGDQTIQATANGLPTASLQALAESYPGVTVQHDHASDVAYFRGPSFVVAEAVGAFERVASADVQLQLDLTVFRYSDARAIGSALDAVRVDASAGPNTLDLAFGSGGSAAVIRAGALSVALSAIERDARSQILAQPRLLFRSGGSGRFASGQEVPVRSVDVSDDGDETRSVSYRQTGIVVDASGSALADGGVSLTVTVELSSLVSLEPDPLFSSTSSSSSVRLADGQTALIGGLTSTDFDATDSGPFGGLRLGSSSSSETVNIGILVTARRLSQSSAIQ